MRGSITQVAVADVRREQVANLAAKVGQNSKNSSKPPSPDCGNK